MSTFQDRMQQAIDKAGGQSALARAIEQRFGIKFSQQSIQYLVSKTPGKNGKLAQGSTHVPQIAAVVGFNPEWLATGKGPRDHVSHTASSVQSTRVTVPAVEPATQIDNVEYTQAALQLARAWMDLPRNERDIFKRAIETAALRYMSSIPDDQLEHLAAPVVKPRQ